MQKGNMMSMLNGDYEECLPTIQTKRQNNYISGRKKKKTKQCLPVQVKVILVSLCTENSDQLHLGLQNLGGKGPLREV